MIPYGRHHIDDDDIQSVIDVLKSGVLTQGDVVTDFENAVANYVGSEYAVAVSSGTAALHLATIAAGLEEGGSMLTTPITFVATSNSALFSGGKVSFVDIDPETVNLSPYDLGLALEINKDVRVIMPVHFAGLPCDMEKIGKLASAHNAVVIEDAAHALGATYTDGSRVGCCSNSTMTTFSFHPVKLIAAGEGGMITTNDESVYRKLLRLRSHGINKLDDQYLVPDQAFCEGEICPWYYEMQVLGYNYRISDIHCSLALSQFKKIDKFIARRKQLALNYNEAFMDCKYIRPAQSKNTVNSAHHLYVIRVDFSSIDLTRAKLVRELRNKGIGSQVHYIPVPSHPFYRRKGYNSSNYPKAYEYYEEALSIPLYYDLTDEQQAYVIDSIRSLIE